MTWKAWDEAAKPPDARLTFFSVERFPFSISDYERAHAAWPRLAPYASRLRKLSPPNMRGFHYLPLADDVSLLLFYGAAQDGLNTLEGAFDAWFLDGFSPAKNPDMWGADLFTALAARSKPGATAATFTVAGHVRRALQGAGFTLEKRPGFGRKREMLSAHLSTPSQPPNNAPWFSRPAPLPPNPKASACNLHDKSQPIAILGAGIAGASLAHSLTRAGFDIRIFDAKGIAAGASGNPGGLIMPRLDLGDTPAAAFFREAYLYTTRLLAELQNPADTFFNPCGVFQPALNKQDAERQEKLLSSQILPPDWMARRQDKTQTGLFFPQAGIVDPARYVATLIGDKTVERARITALHRDDQGWTLINEAGENFTSFRAVIAANSTDAARLFDNAPITASNTPLALSAVAGQIDLFKDCPSPDCAIAAGPYGAPAPNGGLLIGATYDKIALDEAPSPSRDATQSNIDAITPLAQSFKKGLDAGQSQARASVRCQTPDRLPVIGAMPDWDFYAQHYDGLKTGLRADYPLAAYQQGLYILTGLGSRGLVTAPLSAAMITADILGAPAPVAANVSAALHPARFFIRRLKRS